MKKGTIKKVVWSVLVMAVIVVIMGLGVSVSKADNTDDDTMYCDCDGDNIVDKACTRIGGLVDSCADCCALTIEGAPSSQATSDVLFTINLLSGNDMTQSQSCRKVSAN